jgi:hypothetical protein
MPTLIKRGLALVAIILLFNVLWSYLWYLTDSSPNPEVRVARPSFGALYESYIHHTRQLADVEWHAGLVANGYERLNSSEAGFDWSRQRNWAYFPLQPYLARPLTWLGLSPIFALFIVSLIGSVALTLTCVGLVDRDRPVCDQAVRVSLFMLVFVIPPLGWMTNFVVPATAIFVGAYVILRRILSQSQAVTAPLVLCAAGLLLACGLSRVQGVVFSLAIVSAFVCAAMFSRPMRVKRSTICVLIASALLPFIIIALIFQVVANDPLAFQKIQAAWGRSVSLPWTPIVDAFSSGSAVNFGNGTEFPFTLARIALFIALALIGFRYVVVAMRKKSVEPALLVFDGCAVVIGLGLVAMPLMTSTLMSAHRYMTCSAVLVAVALKLGWRPSWMLISLLMLIRMGELVLFSRGYLFLIW